MKPVWALLLVMVAGCSQKDTAEKPPRDTSACLAIQETPRKTLCWIGDDCVTYTSSANIEVKARGQKEIVVSPPFRFRETTVRELDKTLKRLGVTDLKVSECITLRRDK